MYGTCACTPCRQETLFMRTWCHHHGSLDWIVSWTTACSRIQVACILILKNVPDLTQMFLGHWLLPVANSLIALPFRRQIGKTRLHSPPCGFYRNTTDKVESITHSTNSCCSDSEADELGRSCKADVRSPSTMLLSTPPLRYGKINEGKQKLSSFWKSRRTKCL